MISITTHTMLALFPTFHHGKNAVDCVTKERVVSHGHGLLLTTFGGNNTITTVCSKQVLGKEEGKWVLTSYQGQSLV